MINNIPCVTRSIVIYIPIAKKWRSKKFNDMDKAEYENKNSYSIIFVVEGFR